MSTPSPAAKTPAPAAPRIALTEWVKPFLVPYYGAIVAALGAITVGFVVVITLLILVATNFNVLSLIE